jgi:hypothetical protein
LFLHESVQVVEKAAQMTLTISLIFKNKLYYFL